jgi:hypothetical protein
MYYKLMKKIITYFHLGYPYYKEKGLFPPLYEVENFNFLWHDAIPLQKRISPGSPKLSSI